MPLRTSSARRTKNSRLSGKSGAKRLSERKITSKIAKINSIVYFATGPSRPFYIFFSILFKKNIFSVIFFIPIRYGF